MDARWAAAVSVLLPSSSRGGFRADLGGQEGLLSRAYHPRGGLELFSLFYLVCARSLRSHAGAWLASSLLYAGDAGDPSTSRTCNIFGNILPVAGRRIGDSQHIRAEAGRASFALSCLDSRHVGCGYRSRSRRPDDAEYKCVGLVYERVDATLYCVKAHPFVFVYLLYIVAISLLMVGALSCPDGDRTA